MTTREQVLDAFGALYQERTIQPDEVTIQQFADAQSIPYNTAETFLKRLVDEGRASRREIRGGKTRWAYRLTQGPAG